MKTKPKETEAVFQQKVIQLARLTGWLVAHFRPAQNGKGQWRTAVAGDGAGFPDLVLVHPKAGVVFAELKQDGKYPTPKQRAWHDALRAAGADIRIWRPRDWPEVEATLTHKEAQAA